MSCLPATTTHVLRNVVCLFWSSNLLPSGPYDDMCNFNAMLFFFLASLFEPPFSRVTISTSHNKPCVRSVCLGDHFGPSPSVLRGASHHLKAHRGYTEKKSIFFFKPNGGYFCHPSPAWIPVIPVLQVFSNGLVGFTLPKIEKDATRPYFCRPRPNKFILFLPKCQSGTPRASGK